ncbi:Protein of unknown function, partial [Streptomyces sp. DvalAA-14]|uniref:DUF3592 domain-containing protein n=1 Tax=unclassified Streptomyces TaxID=2593676 RepID=UPI00081B0E57
MGIDGVLLGVGGGFGALALLGYGRAFAGVSRARRAVRVPARVVRVERLPESGAQSSHGIPVVVGFTDPDTGREYALPAAGGRRGTLDAAWEGRQVEVRFPPGKPDRFRLRELSAGPRRGLAAPTAALVPAY